MEGGAGKSIGRVARRHTPVSGLAIAVGWEAGPGPSSFRQFIWRDFAGAPVRRFSRFNRSVPLDSPCYTWLLRRRWLLGALCARPARPLVSRGRRYSLGAADLPGPAATLAARRRRRSFPTNHRREPAFPVGRTAGDCKRGPEGVDGTLCASNEFKGLAEIGPHRGPIAATFAIALSGDPSLVPMSVACRVILAACASMSLVAVARRVRDRLQPERKSRNTSSSPSTARTTSRNGSAAARWRRGPAPASPTSCPACSCCRPKRATNTTRRAWPQENPMSALRSRSRRSPTGSAKSASPPRKATRSPAMAAAISTAATGARPTG